MSDDLRDMLKVIAVNDEIGDRPLDRGHRETIDERDVLGLEVRAMKPHRASRLLAIGKRELRHVIE